MNYKKMNHKKMNYIKMNYKKMNYKKTNYKKMNYKKMNYKDNNKNFSRILDSKHQVVVHTKVKQRRCKESNNTFICQCSV